VGAKLGIWLLAGALAPTLLAEAPVGEYRVKGAFLLNFAKFVEWPAQAFKGPHDAIAICVLGVDPFTPALDQAAHDVMVDKRAVTIRQIADPQQAGQCHIVFVSAAERRRTHAVVEAVQAASVLTVGESQGFIADGGMIELRVEDSKIRMEISEAAAKRAGLHISAKLLSLSQAGKR